MDSTGGETVVMLSVDSTGQNKWVERQDYRQELVPYVMLCPGGRDTLHVGTSERSCSLSSLEWLNRAFRPTEREHMECKVNFFRFSPILPGKGRLSVLKCCI